MLQAYPDDDLLKLSELLGKGLKGEAKAYLSRASWVKQEKYKGRRSILSIADNLSGVSSSYCGWSFNTGWDLYDAEQIKIRQFPAQAALLSDDELKRKPFFDLPASRLFGVDLEELVSENAEDPAPSEFVMEWISDTDLTHYYDDNEAAHKLVRVRDWLLAEAFPATTLPMGANRNNRFRDIENQNIDMSADKDNGGCKTSEDLWPLNRKGEWKHSDYKDIPYQHTYGFYKRVLGLTK